MPALNKDQRGFLEATVRAARAAAEAAARKALRALAVDQPDGRVRRRRRLP